MFPCFTCFLSPVKSCSDVQLANQGTESNPAKLRVKPLNGINKPKIGKIAPAMVQIITPKEAQLFEPNP